MIPRWVALGPLCAGMAAAAGLPQSSALAALALPLIALALGPRFTLSPVNQALLTIFAAFLGLMVPTLVGAPPRLYDLALLSERRALFFFAVHAISCARCVIAAPRPGPMLTAGATVVALTAAGEAKTGLFFPILAALALSFCLAAVTVSNPARRERLLQSPRRALSVGLIAASCAGSAILATTYLPKLQEAAIARYYARLQQSQVGFSNALRLGGLADVLVDDTVVLRLRGRGQPEHLRGAVFTRYWKGNWEPPWRPPIPELLETGGTKTTPAGPGWLELEHAIKPERYFLPLDASDHKTMIGDVFRDDLGIHSPPGRDYSKRLWFKRKGTPHLAPPRREELFIPEELHKELTELVQAWGAVEGSPRQRIEKIDQRLKQEYEYELVGPPPGDIEPLRNFLFRNKRGHCEYFASAAALLGRAAGVKTRVITGYRVVEVSRFDYSIVRKRHAHAWIEAWTGSKWITFDPTPQGPLAASSPRQTPYLSSIRDRISTAWEAFDDFLEEVTALQFGLTLVLFVGLLILVRVLRNEEKTEKKKTAPDLPLPSFVVLSQQLEKKGLVRGESETLSSFGERIARSTELTEQQKTETRAAFAAYSSLRYGAHGEPGEVDSRLMSVAERL